MSHAYTVALVFKDWNARHLIKRAHVFTEETHMKRREEYRSKITNDGGLTRGRVPCPLLHELRARPGDYLIFRLDDSGKVAVRLSRAGKQAGKGGSRHR